MTTTTEITDSENLYNLKIRENKTSFEYAYKCKNGSGSRGTFNPRESGVLCVVYEEKRIAYTGEQIVEYRWAKIFYDPSSHNKNKIVYTYSVQGLDYTDTQTIQEKKSVRDLFLMAFEYIIRTPIDIYVSSATLTHMAEHNNIIIC